MPSSHFPPTGGTGGTISGTIGATQVAYGASSDTIAGSANLTFTAGNILTIGGYPIDPDNYIADYLSVVAPTGQSLYFAADADGGPGVLDLGVASSFLGWNAFFIRMDADGVSLSAPASVGIPVADLGQTGFASYRLIDNTASTGSEAANVFQLDVTATDLVDTDALVNLKLQSNFGNGGVASKGGVTGLNNTVIIEGSGDADNEPSQEFGFLSYHIGTGYTQSTGPTGRTWFKDWSVYGPIAVQPETLNGITLLMGNYYNGSPADSPSAGLWIVTKDGQGDDATHQAATTFAMNVGIGIVGNCTGGNGWTTALQIGGTGSPWGESASAIGTGINIRDYDTAAININNTDDVTAPSIIFDTFLQTAEMASAPAAPAANGVRIYAVDNGGKTELLAIFNTGSAVRIAIQP